MDMISSILPAGFRAESTIYAAVAMVVFRIEYVRRSGNGPNIGSNAGAGYVQTGKRLLRQCGPEAAGLLAVFTLAAALRARGDVRAPVDSEAWDRIKNDWPLLMTADTLLALQSMLRFVALLSVVLRASIFGPVPLSDEAAALSLGAAVARATVLATSSVYMLDGPLGGYIPAAFEVAVLPLLLALSRGTLRRAPLGMALVCCIAYFFAHRNHLALTEEVYPDRLFVLAHCFDFLSACCYLAGTFMTADNGPGSAASSLTTGFVHLVMVVQQALPAYYFLEAFAAVPELVGAGKPFEVLQIANVAGLGAYLGAASLYVAERFEGGRTVQMASVA